MVPFIETFEILGSFIALDQDGIENNNTQRKYT